MDNKSSNNFTSNNNLTIQHNQLVINPSSEDKLKFEENIINSDLYAPNPVSNPQVINHSEPLLYNTNISANECPYEPNNQSQGNYLYNTNIPPKAYPYNQNNSPNQEFPYYSIPSESFPNNEENAGNNISQRTGQRKCLIMVLIMSILMLIFLFFENKILSSMGGDYYNKFIIADEIAILICAILFLITFIFNKIIKNNKLKLRTIITSLVLFIGFIIRMFSFGGFNDLSSFDDFDEKMNNHSKQFALFVIRTILLFISIIISVINSKNN